MNLSSLDTQQRRSILSFIVIAFFAVGATVFLIRKGSDAASEIELLNNGQFAVRRALIVKELDETEGLGISDTSTWQTYHNEEYGFEMKYPSDWILGDVKGDSNDVAIRKENAHPEDPGSTIRFSVHALNGLTVSDWKKKNIRFKGPEEPIEVSGLKGFRIGGKSKLTGEETALAVFSSNDIVFVFSAVEKNNIDRMNAILSTFKFIK